MNNFPMFASVHNHKTQTHKVTPCLDEVTLSKLQEIQRINQTHYLIRLFLEQLRIECNHTMLGQNVCVFVR